MIKAHCREKLLSACIHHSARIRTHYDGGNFPTIPVWFCHCSSTHGVFRENFLYIGNAHTPKPVSEPATIKVIHFDGADAVTVDSAPWTSTQSGTIGLICSSAYFVDTKIGFDGSIPR